MGSDGISAETDPGNFHSRAGGEAGDKDPMSAKGRGCRPRGFNSPVYKINMGKLHDFSKIRLL